MLSSLTPNRYYSVLIVCETVYSSEVLSSVLLLLVVVVVVVLCCCCHRCRAVLFSLPLRSMSWKTRRSKH